MNITKYILPGVAGTMLAMILQVFGEKGIHLSYPPPAGLDYHDKAALAQYSAQIPTQEFLLLLANYAVCSLVGGIMATTVSGRDGKAYAIIVGIVLTLAEVFNVMMMPQPFWFSAMSLLMHLPFAFLGYLLVRKKATPAL
jgi:hypothetical protein